MRRGGFIALIALVAVGWVATLSYALAVLQEPAVMNGEQFDMDMGDMNQDGGAMDMGGKNNGTMDMGGMSGMDMKMYFHSQHSGLTLLFKGWNIDCWMTYWISVAAVFVMGLLYEVLITVQVAYDAKVVKNYQSIESLNTSVGSSFVTSTKCCSTTQAIRSCIHGLRVFVSYCLMMVFMTFETGLCLAVVAGAMTGFFIAAKHVTFAARPAGCH